MLKAFVDRFRNSFAPAVLFLGISVAIFACKNSAKPPEKDIVRNRGQLNEHTSTNLQKILTYAGLNAGNINDSVKLMSFQPVNSFYQGNNFQTVWSSNGKWQPVADSMYHMLTHAWEYGLFPADYNAGTLGSLKTAIGAGSAGAMDAALWTRADVLLTDAYLTIARHLKSGRLGRDTISLRKDSLLNDDYFLGYFQAAILNKKILESLNALEPTNDEYIDIRKNIRLFLDSADFSNYTYISYPNKDSLALANAVRQRLREEGVPGADLQLADSVTLSNAIKIYQQSKKLKPTGKISESLIRSLNNTDREKFKSIAITLDRYKSLPETMPQTYVLVNLPSYTLFVRDSGTLAFTSKVIVGSRTTQTPLLNSYISNFITYPQWTVPYSIIFKEMLPKIKNNINFLDKQNLMVVDKDDNILDPSTINWSVLSNKRFPYLIRQKEGDGNSLGVIKFNFPNKYSVYLHDTNARWLFSKSARALSHGCVRVQNWEQLSHFLVRSDTVRYPPDTLRAWMDRQEKHTVTGFPRVPLFIRYFTVEARNKRLNFYDDIYGHDRQLRNKFFAKKTFD